MKQAISTENYASLLQQKKTAEITAKSFPEGLVWLNQMNEALQNMDWAWLSNLCSGVVVAQKEYIEKNKPDARKLPQRELSPEERLVLARRKK